MLKECNICFNQKKNFWNCNNTNCTAIVCNSCHQNYTIMCRKLGCPFCNPLEKPTNQYLNDDEIYYIEDDFGILDLDFEFEIESICSDVNQLFYLFGFFMVFILWFLLIISIYIMIGNLIFGFITYLFNLNQYIPWSKYILRAILGISCLNFITFNFPYYLILQ